MALDCSLNLIRYHSFPFSEMLLTFYFILTSLNSSIVINDWNVNKIKRVTNKEHEQNNVNTRHSWSKDKIVCNARQKV